MTKPTREALRALAQRDRRLGAWLPKLPSFPGFPQKGNERQRTHWGSLSSAIVYQQLHGKAAATIHGRVCALTPGRRFPTPAEFLELPDPRLRGAGLSRQKVLALRDLAARLEDGRLDLARVGRAPDEEIEAKLTQVRGIGPWSARMFLMFRLGRLDVMADSDFGIQEGIRILDGRRARPTPRQALERSEVWRPLRTVACWTLWRIVEHERAG